MKPDAKPRKKPTVRAPRGEDSENRTGIYTSSVVSTRGERIIALFFTGRAHAGENLAKVLRHRDPKLPPPIQMCDGLSQSQSLPGDLKTIVSNCILHARRNFVDLAGIFPEECRFVLKTLGKVYKNDAVTRERNMSPEERLRFHQQESSPWMDKLSDWLKKQFDEKKVEPNSSLGEAISYMKNRWEKLTVFLREPGAPLDNNVAERALKKAILFRKNSLFYKTEHGARVGDVLMSLIYTCQLSGINPFEYLTALQRDTVDPAVSPSECLPWNYRGRLAGREDGGRGTPARLTT